MLQRAVVSSGNVERVRMALENDHIAQDSSSSDTEEEPAPVSEVDLEMSNLIRRRLLMDNSAWLTDVEERGKARRRASRARERRPLCPLTPRAGRGHVFALGMPQRPPGRRAQTAQPWRRHRHAR
jgi:hypothetical protein